MSSPQHSPHLYARGFAFYSGGVDAQLEGFRHVRIGEWNLLAHPRTNYALSVSECGREFVLIIGVVLDLESENADAKVVAEILRGALLESEISFFDRLRYLAGRHVIIYGSDGRVSVVGDACATKALFYANDQPVLGSHFNLVANIAGTGASKQKSQKLARPERRGLYGYAAGCTPDDNVSLLMANMVLRLPEMKFSRFYPMFGLGRLDVDSAAEEMLRLFRIQSRIISSAPVFVSLTAGLDSRISLAALRQSMEGLETFSYVTQPGHKIDSAVAADIAKLAGLNHRIIGRDAYPKSELREFATVLAKNNYHRHNVVAAYAYLDLFPGHAFHVRSNLFEIGRAFYRKKGRLPDRLDADGMSKLYFKSYERSRDSDISSAFSKYIDRSNFDGGLFGLDPYDVFYWEQRMSCWHAMVVLEADPSVETILLFNSRLCIETALSVELSERIGAAAFKALIQSAWPELLGFPINPRVYP